MEGKGLKEYLKNIYIGNGGFDQLLNSKYRVFHARLDTKVVSFIIGITIKIV